MRIGELAQLTGASVRSLRHYEASGLIWAERRSNGYREFPDCTVDTVARIRALLAAGLPVAAISQVLPCVLNQDLELQACDSVVSVLQQELHKLDTQAAQVHRARSAISAILSGAGTAAEYPGPPAPPGLGQPG